MIKEKIAVRTEIELDDCKICWTWDYNQENKDAIDINRIVRPLLNSITRSDLCDLTASFLNNSINRSIYITMSGAGALVTYNIIDDCNDLDCLSCIKQLVFDFIDETS